MALVRTRMPAVACLSRVVYGLQAGGQWHPAAAANSHQIHSGSPPPLGTCKDVFKYIKDKFTHWNGGGYHRREDSHRSERRYLQRGTLTSILAWFGLESRKPSESSDEEETDPLLLIIKRAIVHFDNGDYNLAELELHLALKAAQDQNNLLAQLTIFDLLANNALVQEDFTKAKDTFTHVLRMLIAIKEVDPSRDEQALELSAKIAICFSKLNQFREADEGFRFVISNLEALISKSSLMDLSRSELNPEQENLIILYAMILEWQAKHFSHKRDFDKCVASYKKAIRLAQKYLPDGHPQLGILLNDLSTVYHRQNDFKAAVYYLDKAVHVTRSQYNPDYTTEEEFRHYQTTSYDLAVMYYNLAHLTQQMDRPQETIEYLKKCGQFATIVKEDQLLKEVEEKLHKLKAK